MYHAYFVYNFLSLLRSFRAVEGSILSFIYSLFVHACLPYIAANTRQAIWNGVLYRAEHSVALHVSHCCCRYGILIALRHLLRHLLLLYLLMLLLLLLLLLLLRCRQRPARSRWCWSAARYCTRWQRRWLRTSWRTVWCWSWRCLMILSR